MKLTVDSSTGTLREPRGDSEVAIAPAGTASVDGDVNTLLLSPGQEEAWRGDVQACEPGGDLPRKRGPEPRYCRWSFTGH